MGDSASPSVLHTSGHHPTNLDYLKVWENSGKCVSSLLTQQFTHQLRPAVHHCVSLGFDVLLGALSGRVRDLSWTSWTLSSRTAIALKCCGWTWCTAVFLQQWVSWSFILSMVSHAQHLSVSEALFWTNSLGSPMGNVSVVSCVGHSKVCFKQIG